MPGMTFPATLRQKKSPDKSQPKEKYKWVCQLGKCVLPAGKSIFPARSENAVEKLLPASSRGVLPIHLFNSL